MPNVRFKESSEASSPLLKLVHDRSPGLSPALSRNATAARAYFRPRYILSLTLIICCITLLVSRATRDQARQVWEQSTGISLDQVAETIQDSRLNPWSSDEPQDEDLLYEDNLNVESYEPVHTNTSLLQDQPIEHLYYHENGYLLLPDEQSYPPAKHPISGLITRAQRQWNALLARQSTSLANATAEYRNRYKRHPPKGFDKWFHFAEQNNVILKDEYDQIHNDLQVFRALTPDELNHRIAMIQERPETFTIIIAPNASSRVTYKGEEAQLERATDVGDLIQTFAAELPANAAITFTKHDQPAVALSWEQKNKMLELVSEGERLGPSDFIEVADPALTNWAKGCHPQSELRKEELTDPSGTRKPPMANHRSFIHNHKSAMDLCQHPEIMPLHGYTSSVGVGLGDLLPLFTFAKTVVHADILATPLEQYSSSYIGDDPDWANKTVNKVLWRGSTTGVEFAQNVQWQLSQRARLHFMSHTEEGEQSIIYADKQDLQRNATYPIKDLNEFWLDTSFAGDPVQCDPESCALMEQIIDFAPFMGLDESYQYKYLIDLDGNGWSGRFHRLLSTNSLVIKSTLFPEWYTDRIQPWVHYVPLKIDYTDLYDILAYFIGTPDGQPGHDREAERIASAGKEWAKDHWRREDMAAYLYRLLLEYIRLINQDSTESFDFVD